MKHEHYNWCIRRNDENAYSFLLGTTFSYTSATFSPSCWLWIVHPNWDERYNKTLRKKTPSNSFWLPPIQLKKRVLTLGSRTHRHRQCCLPMAKQFQPDQKHSRKVRVNYQLNANICLFGSTCFGLYAHLQEQIEFLLQMRHMVPLL